MTIEWKEVGLHIVGFDSGERGYGRRFMICPVVDIWGLWATASDGIVTEYLGLYDTLDEAKAAAEARHD